MPPSRTEPQPIGTLNAGQDQTRRHLRCRLTVGADADPLFNGPEQTRLTPWGLTKVLARHVPAPAPPRPRVRGRSERHPTRDQKDPGDAPAPSRSQPDLHTRPARPRRRVHNRDLRPRRHGGETQSYRERLPVAHPRAPAQLDGRPKPPRTARPRLPVTAPVVMWPEPAPAAPPPAGTPQPATSPNRPP